MHSNIPILTRLRPYADNNRLLACEVNRHVPTGASVYDASSGLWLLFQRACIECSESGASTRRFLTFSGFPVLTA